MTAPRDKKTEMAAPTDLKVKTEQEINAVLCFNELFSVMSDEEFTDYYLSKRFPAIEGASILPEEKVSYPSQEMISRYNSARSRAIACASNLRSIVEDLMDILERDEDEDMTEE